MPQGSASPALTRVEIVERNLDAYLEIAAAATRPLEPEEPLREGTTLSARQAVRIFEDQVLSRSLDVAARELKKTNRSYYTIASAGHENNAVVGTLVNVEGDLSYLHYRSGGYMMAQARRRPGTTPAFDTLLSLCAAADDPVCSGRHKVWGSHSLGVIPQTSTIASQLPKAVGAAFARGRARRLGIGPVDAQPDAIVCCSFGDASANHATALAGINSARYAHRRGSPVPILFVCEDNGIGISTSTPRRWIGDAFSNLAHLKYFEAAGDLVEVWNAVEQAVRFCRTGRAPVFLHLRCVRLWGHAGSDVETTYRSLQEIEAIEATDPLLHNARLLVESGAASPQTLHAIREDTKNRVFAAAEQAARRPHLKTRAAVMAPLALPPIRACREGAIPAPDPAVRRDIWGDRLPENATAPSKRTLAAQINAALHDLMAQVPKIVVFGEDVGKKGGVYHLTAGLQKKFGIARVFDTLLDETTILGVAQGAGHVGLLPICEIQYLAYIHNALDQLRGEAASMKFFSDGRFSNPMVVRVAGLAYQRGFGGHFHNDNSIGALRDIPGLVLAVPSRGDDAARMLRGCVALALGGGQVVCFLEPIALYHEKDLYAEGDGKWLTTYPSPEESIMPGEVGIYGDGSWLIVSYANGLRLSLRAARSIDGGARVMDLRWLNPLPFEEIRRHAEEVKKVLVVDECRATGGGIADAVIADLAENGFTGELRSVRAADCFVPLGPSTATVLVTEQQIVEATR